MRKNRQVWQRIQNDERGAALIELTVILPILLTIGLGVAEFGSLIYNYHLISTGIRDAARYAAGLPSGSADNDVKCIALTGYVAGSLCSASSTPSCTTACRVSWWNNVNTIAVTPELKTNDDGAGNKLYRGGEQITLVTVSTDIDYGGVGFLAYLSIGQMTFHIEHEERLYGIR
jgi:Flp pilus assembly protein TadG